MTGAASDTDGLTATRRYSPVIGLIVSAAMFMQNLDSAIMNTSLPQMARSLGVTPIDLSLGITAYILASAAVSPSASWLSQRFGARNVLTGAVLTFTLASLWCGLGNGLPMFVAARIVQGLGGALMMPIGTALVLRYASKADMMRATAITVWPALMAPIIGPVLGGFITETFSWRWNFWLNLPIGLIGALAILRFIPQEEARERRPLDVTGLALCGMGLTCLLAGFQRSSIPGAERDTALALLVVGFGLAWAAIRHLRRHPHPILSLAPLAQPSLRYAALFPGALFRAVFATAPFLLPLLFQLGFGLSPAAAGSWVLVYFCGNLGIKPATSTILRLFGFRNVLWVNGLLVALSFVGSMFLTPTTPKIPMILFLFCCGAARSMQMTCLTTISFADIPGSQRVAAANLQSMLAQSAQAAGVAFGAFCLSLLQALHHDPRIGLVELHMAFAITALLPLVGALVFRGVSPDLGREVSGHRG